MSMPPDSEVLNQYYSDISDYENKGDDYCKCEHCESPYKHNIYAEGFCEECYEECKDEN
jgi:hypothetical protein